MKAALPPGRNVDESDVAADETRHSRTTFGGEHCEKDAPIHPHGDDDCDDDDDAKKTARSQTTRARFFLSIALVLEVASTLWAFQQAVAAGALDGHVDCYDGGRVAKLFASSRLAAECAGPIDADDFYSFTNGLEYGYSGASFPFLLSGSSWEEYVVCDYPTEALTENK